MYVEENVDSRIYCNKKGVFLLNMKTETNTKLAPNYFDILSVQLKHYIMDKETYVFTISVKWRKPKSDWPKDYYVLLNKNLKIKSEDLEEDMNDREIHNAVCIKICIGYVKYSVMKVFNEWRSRPFIGWEERKEKPTVFVGVSDHNLPISKEVPSLFNKELNLKGTESWNETVVDSLFDWILNDTNLLGIFAYTVHALCYHFCGGRKDFAFKDDVFSICIYGKDMAKVHMVANLLSNVFEYDKNAFDRLKDGSYISSSSIKGQPAFFDQIQSVPVIVAHKTDKMTKNSSIIRSYHFKRESGKIGFFPVYVSRNAINADQILDFCVNDTLLRDDIPTLKGNLNILLLRFILFFQTWENERYKSDVREDRWNMQYLNEIRGFERKGEFDTEDIKVRSKILLYIACKIFASFLEREVSRDIGALLKIRAKSAFLEGETEIQTVDAQLSDFAMFIKHTLLKAEQEREFPCVEGTEKGTKEEFIYFNLAQGYSYYEEFCKQRSVMFFPLDTLKRTLSDGKLIKKRSNGAQYEMQRVVSFKGESSKRSVLVIYKNPLLRLLKDS